jgi:flavorubredoxin
VEILATKMGTLLVQNFHGIKDGLRPVVTGDTLDLGQGMVLSFVETPNVHWPETMMTLLAKESILFSCDGFGGFGSTGERLFDDEFSPAELKTYEGESLRYYANIVASFSTHVKNALAKLDGVPIKVVAPSHGIVWRKNPKTIIDLYTKFAGYNTGGPQEKEICVVWGSMHGNTKIGLDAALEGIKEAGVPVTVFRVPGAASSEILAAAFKSKGILFAMPTYEYKMFTPLADVINLLTKKHLTDKLAFRLGSWGWVGGAQKDYEAAVATLDWTQLPAYEWQGVPKPADLEALRSRGRNFAQAVAAL